MGCLSGPEGSFAHHLKTALRHPADRNPGGQSSSAGPDRDAAGQPAVSRRPSSSLHRETEAVEKRELPQFGIPALC